MASMPTTFWKAPPHSSVSPTRRITAFSCKLATGSELTFLSVNIKVGTSLFMPFSTPASNQPVLTSIGSTSLLMGSLALLPHAALTKTSISTAAKDFDVRMTILDTGTKHLESKIQNRRRDRGSVMLHLDAIASFLAGNLAIAKRLQVAALDAEADRNRGVVRIARHKAHALACRDGEPFGRRHANRPCVIENRVDERRRDFRLVNFARPHRLRRVVCSHGTSAAGAGVGKLLHAPHHAAAHRRKLNIEEDAVVVQPEAARTREPGEHHHVVGVRCLQTLIEHLRPLTHGIFEHAFKRRHLLARLDLG